MRSQEYHVSETLHLNNTTFCCSYLYYVMSVRNPHHYILKCHLYLLPTVDSSRFEFRSNIYFVNPLISIFEPLE